MIDLLCEAKNHMELYEFAVSVNKGAEDWLPSDNKSALDWKDRFFLDIPKSDKNPALLKRALLLTAGWRLYHEQPQCDFNDTVKFLDEWYRTVMGLASKATDDEAGKKMLESVERYSEQYKENRFVNLDKINYYRLVCQAQANGPLKKRCIAIPSRMIDVWKEKKVPEINRGLHILYHYCGEMPRVNKTEIEIWLRGYHNCIKSHEILSHVVSPIGDSCQELFLTVDEAFRWSDEEEDVKIPETPRFANRLSDNNLQTLRN